MNILLQLQRLTRQWLPLLQTRQISFGAAEVTCRQSNGAESVERIRLSLIQQQGLVPHLRSTTWIVLRLPEVPLLDEQLHCILGGGRLNTAAG